VLELLRQGRDFTRDNLEEAYVARRRRSWVEQEARWPRKSRDGFQWGVIQGLVGMALTGLTGGSVNLSPAIKRPHERIPPWSATARGASRRRKWPRCAPPAAPRAAACTTR
jgi:electron-transferring-flavoprotein dehydrogenase